MELRETDILVRYRTTPLSLVLDDIVVPAVSRLAAHIKVVRRAEDRHRVTRPR
jgi:hypothetical protein